MKSLDNNMKLENQKMETAQQYVDRVTKSAKECYKKPETMIDELKDFIQSLLTQQRTELLKLVNKAFEETVIDSEGYEYGFYEKLNSLLK